MSNIYNNGKIYKLVCEDGCYYIGSTIQKLNHKFNSHKKSSKKVVCRVYEHINIIGWDKVQIELVENYSCNNKQYL
jgi:predicted GIY-YIG superfamily endonuclease